jgi:hypothetical protein
MEVIFLIGAVQAFFLVILVFNKTGKSDADYVLAGWLGLMGLHLLYRYVFLSDYFLQYPLFISLGISFPLLQGPFMLVYILIVTGMSGKMKPIYWLHGLPYLLFTVYFTYYLPMDHFKPGVLRRTYGVSFCEYKGKASHYDIYGKEQVVLRAAWRYPDASGIYLAIKDHIAVYANLMDACFVNNEKVIAQEGEFYGGWITSNIVGPFKGGAGTYDW